MLRPLRSLALDSVSPWERDAVLLFGWLGMLMFSGTVVATRFAVRELDPTFIALGRALVAAGLAAGVLAAWRAPRPTGEQWRRIALVSAGVVVGFPWLITLALRTMPAAPRRGHRGAPPHGDLGPRRHPWW